MVDSGLDHAMQPSVVACLNFDEHVGHYEWLVEYQW